MKKDVQHSCCFTGHRPQGLPFKENEDHPDCMKLKALLRQELVLELKSEYPQITLESAIPYEEQASNWTVQQRERYYEIAGKCDQETILQTAYTGGCMKKRNHYMVDSSTFVLAVWDGTSRSGTAQTVRYARELCRKIIIINPKTLELTRENQLNTAQA